MTAIRRLTGLVHRPSGPLTEELVRTPGGFGLGQLPTRLKPDAVASLVCGYCSTGCSLDVHMRDDVPVNLSPTRNYPVNVGAACPKGWEALTPLGAPDRATQPMLRDDKGRLQPIDWPTALTTFTSRFKAIQAEHGPASVAFLSTGQMVTEEMALLGALAKFGMGMVHGDGNTRQCMATSVVAYKECFGFDAPPYTYADFEESDVIVLVGSNLCIAHPIMWERICRNPHSPEIIVIDPRRTETAMAATQHYALAPKSDLTFLYGLAQRLIERGAVDRAFVDAHTEGFDAFAAHVASFTPDTVAEASGIDAAALDRLAETIQSGQRVSFWWTMGVNQSHEATRTAQAIIALALMTGSIGRPGTGANSITGQCNAMGSRLFSNTVSLFGGRDFTDAADRDEVARLLGIPVERIPDQRSLAYDQIIEGINRGTIKGLWIIATNTSHSWINQEEVRELLDRLDFLVVQDLYSTTETAQQAHLVLPAGGWGEKEGTFINSERRVGLVKRIAQAPGQALADFAIFKLVAEAWGCGGLLAEWSDPEAVFRILGRLSAGRPCDMTGITGYPMIEERGGIQWPYPAAQVTRPGLTDQLDQQRRLFEDGRFYHADGRARFRYADPGPPAETTNEKFPFVLLTGRGSSSQWHTQTRTSKSPLLRAMYPERAYVEIAPADAERLGIRPHDDVVVRSRRGAMRAWAFVTPTVAAGQVFIPMHYEETNRLTRPAFDPLSRQPSYKHCAVSVGQPEPWDP